MAVLQEGMSSPDVQKAQKQINAYYKSSVVPENGEFDGATTAGVRRFQKDVQVRPSGDIDAATQKLLGNPPKVPGHRVVYKGEEVWLTDEQYKEVLKTLSQAAMPTVEGFKRKTAEIRGMWDGLSQARKDTFFLIPATVDLWAGVKLPPESLITGAEGACAKMEKAVKGTDAGAIGPALNEGADKIEKAVRTMKAYREAFFDGGENLIKTLEMVKEGCVDILEVSAAVATGGSSVAVTASVMASVGAYKSLLGEIDKASKTTNFSMVDALGNVLVDGAVGGTVGALLHDEAFLGSLSGKVAKQLGTGALKKFGSDVAGKLAEKLVAKAFKGGMDKAAESAIKSLVEGCKPGSRMTLERATDDIVKEFFKGAAFGAAAARMSKDLEDLTAKSIEFMKPGLFKGLGKVDPKKAFDKGGEQIVEAAMKRLGAKLVADSAGDPKKMDKVKDDLVDAVLADSQVNAALAALVKKQNLQ